MLLSPWILAPYNYLLLLLLLCHEVFCIADCLPYYMYDMQCRILPPLLNVHPHAVLHTASVIRCTPPSFCIAYYLPYSVHHPHSVLHTTSLTLYTTIILYCILPPLLYTPPSFCIAYCLPYSVHHPHSLLHTASLTLCMPCSVAYCLSYSMHIP